MEFHLGLIGFYGWGFYASPTAFHRHSPAGQARWASVLPPCASRWCRYRTAAEWNGDTRVRDLFERLSVRLKGARRPRMTLGETDPDLRSVAAPAMGCACCSRHAHILVRVSSGLGRYTPRGPSFFQTRSVTQVPSEGVEAVGTVSGETGTSASPRAATPFEAERSEAGATR